MSDTIKQRVEEFDRRFQECRMLAEWVHKATYNQLECEFLDTFLDEYLKSQDITTSIQHAVWEWDL